MGPADEPAQTTTNAFKRGSNARLAGSAQVKQSFGQLPIDEQERLIDILGSAIAELDMKLQNVLAPTIRDDEAKMAEADRAPMSPVNEVLNNHNYRLSRYIGRLDDITSRVES